MWWRLKFHSQYFNWSGHGNIHEIKFLFVDKFRIQSDHLPSVAVILEALIQRIEKYTQSGIRITTSSPLPIKFLMTLVDDHHKSYQKVQIIRVCLVAQING